MPFKLLERDDDARDDVSLERFRLVSAACCQSVAAGMAALLFVAVVMFVMTVPPPLFVDNPMVLGRFAATVVE